MLRLDYERTNFIIENKKKTMKKTTTTATTTSTTKLQSSSSSSSASGHSEDAQNYVSLTGSDHQAQSQDNLDDSGPEESPVYILTSAKGDRSYKLRDSR